MRKCGRSDIQRAYNAHVDDLLSLAMNLINDRHLAEDIVHDVFLRFFQRPFKLRRQSKLRSYLAACVANRARDVHRRQRKLTEERYSDRHDRPSDGGGSMDLVEKNEAVRQAYRALRRLPYEQREAVILKLQHAMSFRQIGRLQKVSTHTAASRYRYGMEKLQCLLKGKEGP